MVDVEKLKEEELDALNEAENEELQDEFFDLEELILLGQDKKIPIIITYPLPDGRQVKAKVLVRQLTLKELDNIKSQNSNLLQMSLRVMKKALFTQYGNTLTQEQIKDLPIGVVIAISNKILELSGVDKKTRDGLSNF
jgi:hypothetical protein